jgi:patatin-like phospholipase/acyl hydrolase
MIKTFTKNDLLRYLYDELPNQERQEMMNAQLTDSEVEHDTEELEDVKKVLEGFRMKAPQEAVDNILAYSRSFKL